MIHNIELEMNHNGNIISNIATNNNTTNNIIDNNIFIQQFDNKNPIIISEALVRIANRMFDDANDLLLVDNYDDFDFDFDNNELNNNNNEIDNKISFKLA